MRYYYFILTAAILLFSGSAHAQHSYSDELALQRLSDNVNRLERDLIMLQKQVYRGGGQLLTGGSISPQDSVRLAQIEENLRGVNGKLEELEHRMSSFASRLDNIIADIDYRITAIEQNSVAEPVKETPVAELEKADDGFSPIELGAVLEQVPATSGYDRALAHLKKKEYVQAERQLRQFVTENPEDELLGNAYYWLGEIFYSRENYQQAAVNFLKGYQDFPKSAKSPDNLLKLAMSLARLDKKQEACATLQKLGKEYPQAEAKTKEIAQEEAKRNGC